MSRPDPKTLKRLEADPTTLKIRRAGLTPCRFRCHTRTPTRIYEQDQHGFIIEKKPATKDSPERVCLFLIGIGHKWIEGKELKYLTELTLERRDSIRKATSEREAAREEEREQPETQ